MHLSIILFNILAQSYLSGLVAHTVPLLLFNDNIVNFFPWHINVVRASIINEPK